MFNFYAALYLCKHYFFCITHAITCHLFIPVVYIYFAGYGVLQSGWLILLAVILSVMFGPLLGALCLWVPILLMVV